MILSCFYEGKCIYSCYNLENNLKFKLIRILTSFLFSDYFSIIKYIFFISQYLPHLNGNSCLAFHASKKPKHYLVSRLGGKKTQIKFLYCVLKKTFSYLNWIDSIHYLMNEGLKFRVQDVFIFLLYMTNLFPFCILNLPFVIWSWMGRIQQSKCYSGSPDHGQ